MQVPASITPTSQMKRSATSANPTPKKRKGSIPSRIHNGDEWMCAGVVPIRRGASGWEILAVVETKGGKTVLSPLKGKREVGEEVPAVTATREFNEEAHGAFRALQTGELDDESRVYISQGKMVFYRFEVDEGDRELGPGTKDVVWAPIAYRLREKYLGALQNDLGLEARIKPHFAFIMVASQLNRLLPREDQA